VQTEERMHKPNQPTLVPPNQLTLVLTGSVPTINLPYRNHITQNLTQNCKPWSVLAAKRFYRGMKGNDICNIEEISAEDPRKIVSSLRNITTNM
jgi:hypothetical protein